MNKRRTPITYKIDSGANSNLMPYKDFKTLFLQVNNRNIAHHKNNVVVFKTYNNSNIEQLGVCSVKLRYKEKVA